VVGRGGMGVVYAAWDQRLERRVAIKLVAPGDDQSQRRSAPPARTAQKTLGQRLALTKHPFVYLLGPGGDHESSRVGFLLP
jgi:eukaryotic-like serine/threonine-protein kinase